VIATAIEVISSSSTIVRTIVSVCLVPLRSTLSFSEVHLVLSLATLGLGEGTTVPWPFTQPCKFLVWCDSIPSSFTVYFVFVCLHRVAFATDKSFLEGLQDPEPCTLEGDRGTLCLHQCTT